jgi:hypothetical protein
VQDESFGLFRAPVPGNSNAFKITDDGNDMNTQLLGQMMEYEERIAPLTDVRIDQLLPSQAIRLLHRANHRSRTKMDDRRSLITPKIVVPV